MHVPSSSSHAGTSVLDCSHLPLDEADVSYFTAPYLEDVPVRNMDAFLDISEEQLILLETHSFLNILHQIEISIRMLSCLCRDSDIFDETLRLSEQWKIGIRQGRLDMDISVFEKTMRSAIGGVVERTLTDEAERIDYIQITGILGNIFVIFQAHWKEFIQRRTINDRVLLCTAEEIRMDISEVFRIVAMNSRGRYGIVFDRGLKTDRDYLIDIRIFNETGAGGENVVRFPFIFKDILRDLIANSRKYSPIGSEITCTIRENSEHIFFSIADRGHGIPEQELDRVFIEYGYRGSNVRDHLYGHGIGLLKALYFTKKFGGALYVRTKELRGTEIVIVIPKEAFKKRGI